MRIAQQLAAFSDEVQLFNLRGLNRDDHSPVKDLFGPYEFLVGKSKPNLPSRKGGRVHVVAREIGNRGATGDSNTIRIGREDVHMNTYIWGISGVTVAGRRRGYYRFQGSPRDGRFLGAFQRRDQANGQG